MLRLVDRFELITYVQAVGPSVRLAGSLIAWATGAGVDAFLIAWAVAALAQHGATWAAALACSRLPIAFGTVAWQAARRENQGIWGFMITTNAAGTVSLLTEQLATLAVGGALGATEAGGYRIAAKIARALARPIQIAARIVYPEMARLHASADLATLDHVMTRVSRYALALAAAVILIGVAGGPWLIRLLAGSAYDFAYGTVAILAVGVAIDLSGFALEPLLVAHGRSATILRIRLAGAALFAVLLFTLLPALHAAAIATVMAALLGRILMGRSVMALPKGR
jgi:O-antigen/teichoic acid export membrane protein